MPHVPVQHWVTVAHSVFPCRQLYEVLVYCLAYYNSVRLIGMFYWSLEYRMIVVSINFTSPCTHTRYEALSTWYRKDRVRTTVLRTVLL